MKKHQRWFLPMLQPRPWWAQDCPERLRYNERSVIVPTVKRPSGLWCAKRLGLRRHFSLFPVKIILRQLWSRKHWLLQIPGLWWFMYICLCILCYYILVSTSRIEHVTAPFQFATVISKAATAAEYEEIHFMFIFDRRPFRLRGTVISQSHLMISLVS